MTNAIDTQLIADTKTHTTGLWPMIALSNIAQGSAVLAYYFMHRHDEKEAQISLPAAISAYLGVTEPALFGVNVKYIYPFVAGMIGSSVAGLLATTFNVQANSIGVGGLPGFLSINVKYMGYFFICMAVAIFIPLFLTLFFKKSGILTKTEEEKLVSDAVIASTTETKSAKEKAVVSGTKLSVVSPLSGLAKPLDQASDPVFSQGIMGKGVVIDPSDGELVSPVDATVSVLFPTKHAIGLLTSEGVEFLIHIGMDTVNLEGKGFTSHVAQGDNVKVGDKLITFDIPMIKEEGYIVETPILITNQEEFRPEELIDLPKQIKRGQALMVAKKI